MIVGVLGATGMVGSSMARELAAAGHTVVDWGLEFSEPPDVLINCAGVVPQRGAPASEMIRANSYLPLMWAEECKRIGTRFIHISTDCVFSGKRGMYNEDDKPDAEDLYGRTKALGEVGAPHLTIRTSVIGHSDSDYGLVNWLMRQQGIVQGWSCAYFSGLTNIELAGCVAEYVLPNEHLSGVLHIAGPRISKRELISRIAYRYDLPIAVVAADTPKVDRSLDGSRFMSKTGFVAPPWDVMIEDMFGGYHFGGERTPDAR